jgi:hypothetical protein
MRVPEFQFAVSVSQFTVVWHALGLSRAGVIGKMEATMHGTFERSRETRNDDSNRGSGIGFLAVPVIIAVAMVALVIAKPEASVWIAQAAQAEAGFIMPDAAPTQPAGEIRSVKAD